MNSIGGNITAQYQVKTEKGRNRLGENVVDWVTVNEIRGFLDLSNSVANGANYSTYNAKIQESTHVFICDYVSIDKNVSDKRMLIDGEKYDVKLIDDPMNLHEHLEIFLEFVGVIE